MATSSPLISVVPMSRVFSGEDEMECVDVNVTSFPIVNVRRNSLDSKAHSYAGVDNTFSSRETRG